jgi:ribosomal-protein-alanine N-acetyltransferase
MNAEFRLNGKTIETKRLILRPFVRTDLDDFFEYASVEGTGEMAGWHHHQDKQKSQEILDLFISEDKTFAVCLKETGKVIGSLGVEKYGMEDKLTEFDGYRGREIGYVLSRDYWGQGLMTEAVRAVIDYLFNECDLDFLTCGYYDFNNRSRRVQEKCGFRPYRKLVMDTRMGTKEPGVLNLMTNPGKDIRFVFSHPETLIIKNAGKTRILLTK